MSWGSHSIEVFDHVEESDTNDSTLLLKKRKKKRSSVISRIGAIFQRLITNLSS